MRPDRAFIRSLIGKPYEAGGQGPDAFDCYGLARHVLRKFGVSLPDREAPIDRRAWRRLSQPLDGALVLMGRETHVGVWIGGGVLHALEGAGVVFDDVASLGFRGFSHLRIYTPA